HEKLIFYLNGCGDMRISILPPDVNSSQHAFTPDGKSIRFGLTAIKNVGETAMQSVLAARQTLGRLESLFQFCESVALRLLNKRVIESLIKAGALDSLGGRRAQMTAALDRAMEFGGSSQREAQRGQNGLLSGVGTTATAPHHVMSDVLAWSLTA